MSDESLDALAYVQAVAIIRRLVEDGWDEEARLAGQIWLREHRPAPDIYLAALEAERKLACDDGR